MIIRNNYRGCIKSGNYGDDILFFILLEMYKKVLENKFNKNFLRIRNANSSGAILKRQINVIGGGSLMYPAEMAYTIFSNLENNYLFINGTGMTDHKKSHINENNIQNVINKKSFKDHLFNLSNNFQRIRIPYLRKNAYGGYRGLLEKQISLKHNINISEINDIGLFADWLITDEDKSLPNIFNKNRKVIFLNSVKVGGYDAFKNPNDSYDQYNKIIRDIYAQFAKYLIQKGYAVFISSFGDSADHGYYNESIKLLSDEEKNFIELNRHNKNLNYLTNIIQNCYAMIATRLHGTIVANGLNIPSLNIGYGIKHLNYAITNNFLDYYIPTFTKYMKLENFINKFEKIEQNYSEIQSKLNIMKLNSLNKYMNEIGKMLQNYNEIQKYKNFEITYRFYPPCGIKARFDLIFS